MTIPGAPVEVLVFMAFAVLAIVGAIAVVAANDPFHSALALIVNFSALGVLYLTLGAAFVAIAQVIVYAGAVVVLFLFVIAYLGNRRELVGRDADAAVIVPIGLGLAGTLFALITWVVAGGGDGPAVGTASHDVPAGFGSVAQVGESFLTTYVLAFEVTSIILLVAAIGGVILGLTGRERHRRLQRVSGSRSADQQRRVSGDDATQDPAAAPGGGS